jgi:hypothetical protein
MSGLKSESMNDEIEQRACHHGATSRVEHTAIRLGEKPAPAQNATCSADFSAGSRRRSDLFCRAQLAPRILRSFAMGQSNRRQQIHSGLARSFSCPDRLRSQQYVDCEDPNRSHNFGSLFRAITEHTATSKTAQNPIARNCG